MIKNYKNLIIIFILIKLNGVGNSKPDIIEKNNIKKERSDKRGTMNDDATIEYISKSKRLYMLYYKWKNNNSTGSGFFCKIPYTKNKNLFLNVLITCEHVLTEDIVFSNKNIKLKVNDKEKIISLEKERKRWSNKEMDYSCIEILKEDNILKYYQLDDDVLNNEVNNDIYLNKNIIIFAIMNKKRGHCDGLI